MVFQSIINLSFLIGCLAFVWGLRLLSSPDSARRGNVLAGFGMGLAIVATMILPLSRAPNNYMWIFAGMIIGGVIGWIAARRIQMTAMPQMVSVFNGLGGACAMVLAFVELVHFYNPMDNPGYAHVRDEMSGGPFSVVLFALVLGSISFTGSMLAFGKLQGLVNDKKVTLPNHSIINLVLLVATVGLSVWIFLQNDSTGLNLAIGLLVLALIYGVSFVAPIGGADMPVVISLLNSITGLSAAAAGLIYNNQVMLVGGILVGAAGTILTVLMCAAMNRSLINVIIGGFGGGVSAAKGDGDQVAREVSISDAAIQLYYSQSVVFVPGYGLAVAQAQKVCKELDDLLESNGVDVKYAIHPVAGRMPGHMNVLLAEADVPYPKLLDLEDANEALPNTDIVVIVGANDVVNPAALDDPGSPIYGMPVRNVWDAKHIIVMKRSMSPGYAGIQNQLFFHEKNRMLFGDAKKSIQALVSEVKTL
jgi:NAD(P) transhydrogenase subunit beta